MVEVIYNESVLLKEISVLWDARLEKFYHIKGPSYLMHIRNIQIPKKLSTLQKLAKYCKATCNVKIAEEELFKV